MPTCTTFSVYIPYMITYMPTCLLPQGLHPVYAPYMPTYFHMPYTLYIPYMPTYMPTYPLHSQPTSQRMSIIPCEGFCPVALYGPIDKEPQQSNIVTWNSLWRAKLGYELADCKTASMHNKMCTRKFADMFALALIHHSWNSPKNVCHVFYVQNHRDPFCHYFSMFLADIFMLQIGHQPLLVSFISLHYTCARHTKYTNIACIHRNVICQSALQSTKHAHLCTAHVLLHTKIQRHTC